MPQTNQTSQAIKNRYMSRSCEAVV